jgi:hypothetical protein
MTAAKQSQDGTASAGWLLKRNVLFGIYHIFNYYI